MISRTAEQCFWLFRYLERGEMGVRLLASSFLFYIDNRSLLSHDHLLLALSGERELFFKLYPTKMQDGELAEHFLMWQEVNPNSVQMSYNQARENARLTRETIGETIWQKVNHIYLWLQNDEAQELYLRNRYRLYTQLLETSQLIKGIRFNANARDDYFHVMQLGIMIERVNQILSILSNFHGLYSQNSHPNADDYLEISTLLLDSCASTDSYLRLGYDFKLLSTLDFFLHEEQAPFSLSFCMKELQNSLQELCHKNNSLHSSLRYAEELRLLLTSIDSKNILSYNIRISSLLFELNTTISCAFADAAVAH